MSIEPDERPVATEHGGHHHRRREDSARAARARRERASRDAERYELARSELREAIAAWAGVPTDELSLAALLESRGITDELARQRYGCPEVFALAHELYPDLPATRTDAEPSPRRLPPWSAVVRGATYLVPISFILLAYSSGVDDSPLVLLAVITCVGWGSTQALARVAYRCVNRGGAGSVRRYLGGVLALGAVAASAVGWVVAVESDSAVVGGIVGAQVAYLALSVAVLPLQRDRLLLACMAPGLLATAAVLVGGLPVWVALVLGLSGEVVVGAAMARSLMRTPAEELGRPERSDLGDALPFLGTGVAAGMFVLGTTTLGASVLGDGALMVALITALTVSMGIAEVQIVQFRRRMDDALNDSRSVHDFGRVSRRILYAYTAAYAAVVVGLEGLALVVVDDLRSRGGLAIAVVMALVGIGLFLNLCLMIVDGIVPALFTFAAAAIALVVLLNVADSESTSVSIGLATCVVVAAAMWVAARSAVATPTRHSFG